MALSLTEKVEGFAERVKSFAIQAAESAKVKKLARALRGVSEALGEEGSVEVDGEMISGVHFQESAEVLTEQESANQESSQALAKEARAIEVFMESDVLDDTEAEIAGDALALWASVKPSSKLTVAPKGGARSERASTPDFDFPIFATCEECGDVIRTGATAGRTDWNSLRHYSQRHGQNVHAAPEFKTDQVVNSEWQNAKRAFESGETKVRVDGNGDIPGFVLEAQEVESKVS